MKHADGEEEFIAGLINLTGGDKSLLGDDCALLKNYNPPLLIAADCLTKNIHYDNSFTPAQIAEKLVGVNVSDFAAMGGRPQNAILTLCSSRGIEFQEELSTNIIKYLNKKNVTLVGGDISAAPKNHETVTLTMLGAIKKETLMWRHLGQPEDLLAISGPLGGAATVLSTGSSKREILHQIPDNLSLGENLAELGVRCAIDISDGLLKDLQRILRAS
ncbi:MAG: AIR synthase related protein, partial [bacterium]